MTPVNPNAKFPIWQYLGQPIGHGDHTVILNPRKFWRQSKLRHIERCWIMSYVPEGRTL